MVEIIELIEMSEMLGWVGLVSMFKVAKNLFICFSGLSGVYMSQWFELTEFVELDKSAELG